jgi:G3E family GTPase
VTEAPSKPPVVIVTGFLGAGKTTLLRRALAAGLAGRRPAIVVNELGEVGLDGALVASDQPTLTVTEMTGACVCCAVPSGELEAAFEGLLRYSPGIVLLETTGAADPWSLEVRLRTAGWFVDAVLTVVDAHAMREALATSEVAVEQIEAADVLVVAKAPLDDRTRAVLRALNPDARIVDGSAPWEMLFGPAERVDGTRPDHGHAEPGYRAETVRVAPVDDVGALAGLLAPEVLRAKGVLVVDGAPVVFQYSFGRWDTAPAPAGLEAGVLTLLGEDPLPAAARVRA